MARRRRKLPADRSLAHPADASPVLANAPGYREFPEPPTPARAFEDQLGTAPSGEGDAQKPQDDHVPDMRIQEMVRLPHPPPPERRDTRPES
jgi:hypothetical protein